MSDSIIERLRHHAQDERNTAFARSTMREAADELARVTAQCDAILTQARIWSGEAKAQKATVDAVGEILGGVPDWGPIAQGVEQLRAELAASRHELVGAEKSARAQARIIESLQQQRAHLNAQRDQWIEARNTLESERAANATLTEELAASREREARMRALIADDGHAMTFQSLGQYRTTLLRALAEGAHG